MPELNVSGASAHSPLIDRVLKGSLFVAVGRTAGIGLALVVNLLLARILDVPDYGRFSLLFSTIMVFSTGARFGFDRLVLKLIAELDTSKDQRLIPGVVRNSLTFVALSSIVSAIIMSVALPLFTSIRGASTPVMLVIIAIGSMFAMTFLQIIAEAFRGFHDLKRAELYNARRTGPLVNLMFCLVVLLSAAAVIRDLELWLVMTLLLLSQVIVLVLATTAFRKRLKTTVPPSLQNVPAHKVGQSQEHRSFSSKSLAHGAAPIAGADLLAVLMALGDMWIAGAIVSDEQLAIWGVAAQLMHLVLVPLNMINLSIMSSIPALHRRGQLTELQRVLRISATLATAISLIPLGLFILVPGTIIAAVFGPAFVAASLPLAILSVGKLFVVWSGSCGLVLLFTGHQRVVLINNFVSTIVLFIAGYFVTVSFGLTGLAIVVAVVTIVSNLSNCLLARLYVGVWTFGTPFLRSYLTSSNRNVAVDHDS